MPYVSNGVEQMGEELDATYLLSTDSPPLLREPKTQKEERFSTFVKEKQNQSLHIWNASRNPLSDIGGKQ